MSQLSTAVLKDNANADHSFNPQGVNGGIATLAESTGVPIGEKVITASRTKTSSGRVKVTFKVTIPVVQDVVLGGVSKPTIVRNAIADISFNFDGTSSTGERADTRALVSSLLGHTMFKGMVENLDTLY